MREDINTFAQRKEHALSNMAIVVLLSHGEDGLVFGTGKYGTAQRYSWARESVFSVEN